MSDVTLVLRLAGPLQSWGGASKFKERGTLGFPTYSGLVGLFSAALGFGRFDYTSRHLFDRLAVVVRVDRSGVKIRDYQTVGATDSGGWQVPTGNGRPWKSDREFATEVSTRYYLSDASFTVFVSGSDSDVSLLAAALRSPKWQLSLGRKTCVPDYPLVLGVWPALVSELLSTVPFIDVESGDDFEVVPVQVHWLCGSEADNLEPVYVPDSPRGPHPQDGYVMRRRFVDRFTYSAPRVGNRDTLLDWIVTSHVVEV